MNCRYKNALQAITTTGNGNSQKEKVVYLIEMVQYEDEDNAIGSKNC